MGETDHGDVVAAYWAHHRAHRSGGAGSPTAHDTEWAVDEVIRTVRGGGTAAVDLVRELADVAADDDEVIILGSGPVEDLLNDHGLDIADEMDVAMAAQPHLRVALTAVRLRAGVPMDLPAGMTLRQWYEGT